MDDTLNAFIGSIYRKFITSGQRRSFGLAPKNEQFGQAQSLVDDMGTVRQRVIFYSHLLLMYTADDHRSRNRFQFAAKRGHHP